MRRFLNLQKRKEKKGFTLIEVLLAMTISLIGLAAAGTLLLLGYKQFYFGQNVARVRQQARIALEQMVKELQQTNADTVDTKINAISFASATFDSGMPDWKYVVVYVVDSITLYRYKADYNDWSPEGKYTLPGNPSLDNLSGLGAPQIILGDPNPEDGRYPGKEKVVFVTSVGFQLSGNLLNITIKIVLDPNAKNLSEEELITAIGEGEIKEEELTTAIALRN